MTCLRVPLAFETLYNTCFHSVKFQTVLGLALHGAGPVSTRIDSNRDVLQYTRKHIYSLPYSHAKILIQEVARTCQVSTSSNEDSSHALNGDTNGFSS